MKMDNKSRYVFRLIFGVLFSPQGKIFVYRNRLELTCCDKVVEGYTSNFQKRKLLAYIVF